MCSRSGKRPAAERPAATAGRIECDDCPPARSSRGLGCTVRLLLAEIAELLSCIAGPRLAVWRNPLLIAPGSKFSGTHEDSLHGNSLFAQLVKDARRIRLPLVKARIKDLRVGSLAAHGVPFLPGVPGDGRGRCGRRFSPSFRAVLLHASVQRNEDHAPAVCCSAWFGGSSR